jgi:single-stranded DNA-binding protein
VVANELVMFGGGGERGGSGGGGFQKKESGGNNFEQKGPDYDAAPAGHGTEITDDDIPF